MAIKITHDAGAPTASIEFMITHPLPEYDLEDVAAPIPRDVDPMLASQGFKDLLDETRTVLDRDLPAANLEIAQLTGAICHDKSVHRPGIWLVLRERDAGKRNVRRGNATRSAHRGDDPLHLQSFLDAQK